MSEHTKGPWKVGPYYKSDVESREGRVCECLPFGSPRASANAHLIAAAPDLKDALQYILDNCGDPIMENVARAAIAKAEGRHP